MAEPQQGAGVARPDRQAAAVSIDRFLREGGARERRRAQEMRLRLRRFERNHAVEALERLAVAVLLLAQAAEVEERQQEIRGDLDGTQQ